MMSGRRPHIPTLPPAAPELNHMLLALFCLYGSAIGLSWFVWTWPWVAVAVGLLIGAVIVGARRGE